MDAVEPDETDCAVVVAGEGWRRAVETLRTTAPALPVVVTGEADPVVGAAASRLGVEYAPREALDATGETLASRVRETLDRGPASADGGTVEAGEGDHERLRTRVARDPWFETVFQHGTSFVALLAPDGTLVRANDRGLDAATESADDLYGRPFWEVSWWARDDAVATRIRDGATRASDGERVSFRTDYFVGDQRRSAEMMFTPVVDDGDVVGVVASGHDVTEVERNEDALRDLHRVSTDADGAFAGVVDELLAVGCEYLDLDIGFLSFIEESADRFEVVTARGDHPDIRDGTVASLSTTYCRRTIDSDGLLAVTDARNDPGWRDDPAVEKYDLGCYVGGKILVDGDLVGTLCFADGAARDRSFSEVEASFVELLVERVTHELEREERETELQAARDRLDTVLSRIDDGFLALDTDWEFTYLNDGGYEVIDRAAGGAPPEDELPGQNIWDVIPDAAGTGFEENYRRAMATQEPVSFEEHYEPLDRWFGVNAYPSEEGLSVFFQDITERKHHERALNALLSTTRKLMSANDRGEIAAVACDAASDVLDLEYALVRLYDAERDLLVPAARSDAVAAEMDERPEYAPGEGLPGRVFERGEMQTYEGDEPVLPGDPGDLSTVHCFPLGDEGTLTVASKKPSAFDHDRRTLASLLAANAEEALDRARREERLQQYRAIHENVREMVFVLDADNEVQLVTEPLADVLGVEPEAVGGAYGGEFIASEDVALGERLIGELAEEEADASRAFETRLLTPDGELPVEIEFSKLSGEQFEGTVGVVRDRTEVETERARFTSLFDRSPDAITDTVLTDDGPILRDVNPSFEETFGVDREQAVGRSTNDLIVPDGESESAEHLDELDPEALTVPTEVVRETATGTGTFLFRGVHYGDTERGPRAFGIYTDISDRKLNERRIGLLNRVLRHNLRNSGTVVEGYLDLLAEEVSGTASEHVERARDAADRILDIAEQVRDIERTFERDQRERHPSPLIPLVENAVADVREDNSDATFHVDVPDVRVVDDDLLEKAVGELVENAAIHAGGSPVVSVTGSVEGGAVHLRVTDDGPGIPRRERRVITGDVDISQLDHSRGLGLWLAWYATDSIGGSLTFDEDHDGGAVVLELPLA
ncbi:PAS domain-containing protein [Halorarius halobius]|uniref:PAS domain-containing protein n=1 Tax=Halorarius halobius TaxID=2962671 RepID=UPI0020CDE665|nr:PAS domain-containing protein [Halorarius halobius]